MKIRIDFVTNSSSSSFVAVNLGKGTLAKYLSDIDMDDLFEQIDLDYQGKGDPLMAELDKSFAQSIINILEMTLEDEMFLEDDEDDEDYVDEDIIEQIIKFISKNKTLIDSEAEGDIELRAGNGEDGFAYVQRLIYKKHHGKLIKWPCVDGWDEGYYKIMEFNSRMFNGEVSELADLAYEAIWELIWDDKKLETALEKTAVVEEFDIDQLTEGGKADYEPDLSLEEIEPVNVDWISGALFVFTGLSEEDESIATDIIEENGGVLKSSVVLKTNYVIYNPYYNRETVKLKRAHELIEKGKPIQLLTVSEFCEKLIASEN